MWMVELVPDGDLLVHEAWPIIEAEGTSFDGPCLRPPGRWLSDPLAHAETGLIVGPDDDPSALAGPLPRVVAIRFPGFADGRGYSIARRLREHHGYRARLWAVGEVLLDQLHLIARVGFDAFVMSERPDLRVIRRSLARYPTVYQTAADGRQPAWLLRRRNRAA